jgi:putative ABC transport system permease protein
MRAVIVKLVSELRRRRLQTALLTVIIILASGTATIALNLIAESSNPYDQAFEEQKGAHLIAVFDSSKAAAGSVAETGRLVGASRTAGPWPLTNVPFEHGTSKNTLTVVGRDNPGGMVEVLRLSAGRWVAGPGEIVVTRSFAEQSGVSIGNQMTALSVATKPVLRVVGEAIDIDEGPASSWSQSAWVVPDQAIQLVGPGNPMAYTMAYRFGHAPSATQLGQDISRLQSAFEPGALRDTTSYLDVRNVFNVTASAILTLLLAFSVFALGSVALIVANVVTGAVIAGYREIGIMKAVGFTPAQVVQVFVGQMAAPALAGCAIGIPLGLLVSQPLLNQASDAMALPSRFSFSPWIPAATVVGLLVVVLAAAIWPAWRAGRLNPVAAISRGIGPTGQRRSWLGRGLGRLGLPRPLSLGADDALVRPVRGGLTIVAILLGVATLTFAYGLHGSFNAYHDFAPLQGQVIVTRTALYPDSQVMATLKDQPETAGIVRVDSRNVSIAGLPEPVQGTFYKGDSTRVGWLVLKGRWFAGPGEAVVASAFLKEAHLRVGDSVGGAVEGRPIRLRIVGMTFDPDNSGRVLIADWSTLAGAIPAVAPYTYYVELRHGADPSAYARRILATQPEFLSAQVADFGASSFGILESVMLALVVVLILIAIVGVFNTILLNTRERIHDTAILRTVGMTPRQVLAVVAGSATVIGLLGGLLGVPAGMALHRALMGLMGNLLGNDMPAVALNVFNPLVVPLLAVVGILVAILGAAAPASWAARIPIAEILHTE